MSFENLNCRSLLSAAALVAATFCLAANDGSRNVRVNQPASARVIELPRIRSGLVQPNVFPVQLASVPVVENPRIRIR